MRQALRREAPWWWEVVAAGTVAFLVFRGWGPVLLAAGILARRASPDPFVRAFGSWAIIGGVVGVLLQIAFLLLAFPLRAG